MATALVVAVASSGAISNHLRYCVYGFKHTRDGYIENISGGDLWDEDSWEPGAQIQWDATDRLNPWQGYYTIGREQPSSAPYGLAGDLITPYLTDVVNVDPLAFNPAYGWHKPNPAVEDPFQVDMDSLGSRVSSQAKFRANYRVTSSIP